MGFYREELSRHAKDGLDSLRAGMKELKEYGYLKRFPVRDDKNKIIKWETIIYEVPQNDPVVEKPPVEIPPKEKPPVEKPPVENPKLLNTKELNTKELSTYIQSSSSIFSFYENNFGTLNSFIAENISQWVNDTSEELVQAAMERALKQQKKWNYAEGILKQWVNNNVKTLKDVDALETEYQRNKGVKNVSESIGRVMTRIVNTSACSEETEGYTCEQCNKYIAAITVEVPQLRIKTKYFLHVSVL